MRTALVALLFGGMVASLSAQPRPADSVLVHDTDAAKPAPFRTDSVNAMLGIYVFAENNQASQQQAQDELECYRQAVAVSGYDPLGDRPPGRMSAGKEDERLAAFRESYISCLAGRGYRGE